MDWLILALVSAFFLGIYDVLKKFALNDNAVFPTLFFVTLTGTLFFTPFILVSKYAPELLEGKILFIPPITWHEHFLIFLKSILVTVSWSLSYLALRNLPITIVSPIRATSPLWTLFGAMLIFGERLNPLQWVGIIVTLGFFYQFTFAGKKEGIHFKSNVWIWCIIGGTLSGATSSLYDKYLLTSMDMDKMALQAWFTFYQVFLLIPMVLFYWKPRKHKYPFQWRWAIPFIAVFLLIADFLYFYALSIPDSLVSIVSPIRRSGVVVAFIFGAFMFKEQNLTRKAYLLIGILAGIFIIMYGSR